MPLPKLYQEKKDKELMPFLDITNTLCVVVKDEEGCIIAQLTDPTYSGYLKDAEQQIRDQGYSTSWAEWDAFGAFKKVK